VFKRFASLGWVGWLICAVGAVLLAVLANIYIIVARPFGATVGIPIDQTGPIGSLISTIVPYVWLFLFAGMGSTFWILTRMYQHMTGRAWLVLALLLICAGYPVYTGGLNQPIVALVGNAVVVLVAALAVWFIWPVSRPGAALLLPVIAWVSFASVALIALITGQQF
jgi:tryptophan-rich sensory protein